MARKVKPINSEQKYCSPRQAAGVLGTSEYLIFREVAAGHIPHRRVGRRILIPISWVYGEVESAMAVGVK